MRYGGVSEGLFESLNGKKGTGDSDSNVDENRRRVLQELDRDERSLAHIIHAFGSKILEASQPGEHNGYDASLTFDPRVTLSQTTADCASIILGSADNTIKITALIHGSWKTLNTDLVKKVVIRFTDLGVKEADIVAGLGPMICQKCYEFGPEAKDLFDEKYLLPNGDKYLVDLKAMVISQLQAAGVSTIDDCRVCTYEDERFFSHRRSGAHSGRYLTIAALPDVI